MNDILKRRIEEVRDRVDIVKVVSKAVKLSKGKRPRGQCPFHGSKSDSLAVDPARGRVRCWGCDWSGDAIAFVRDHYALSFIEALERLEGDHGLEGLSAAPVQREKTVRQVPERDAVDSKTMGRYIWKQAKPQLDKVRTYLRARGVPAAMLGDGRLADFRFCARAPIVAWPENRKPASVPHAPAMVALVRHGGDWAPMGVHVTYLAPDLSDKMERRRQDGSKYPPRKMLGDMAGGCVVLPGAGSTVDRLDLQAPLYLGEGLETVLCGMAIAGAGPYACGIAALSLGTLAGHARLIKGATPLYDPQPDPERSPALTFEHDGPVTGLIDADMKPLRGPKDPRSGKWRGVPVIEVRRGPIVRRTISTAERAALCGTLFVRAWRDMGCQARAVRPHMGQDFNDAMREGRP